MLARALAADASHIEKFLHLIERLLVDQRLVASGKDLLVRRSGFVDDPSGVVAIAQQTMKRGAFDLARRVGVPPGRPGAQTHREQVVFQFRYRILAAAEQLERGRDECVALRIELDAGDLATIRQQFGAVDVAEFGRAVGASFLRLLQDALGDVAAGFHGLVLVVEGEHALHVERLGRVLLADHRLGDRDNPRLCLLDQLDGAVMVLDVARPARQAPNDDVVDPRCRVSVQPLDLIEHLQELDALMQIGVGALAGVAPDADQICV